MTVNVRVRTTKGTLIFKQGVSADGLARFQVLRAPVAGQKAEVICLVEYWNKRWNAYHAATNPHRKGYAPLTARTPQKAWAKFARQNLA